MFERRAKLVVSRVVWHGTDQCGQRVEVGVEAAQAIATRNEPLVIQS